MPNLQSEICNLKPKKYHRILAEYFERQPLFFDEEKRLLPNKRKCIEQPFQQTRAEMWDEVTETLCEIFFVEAKVKAGLVDALQGDYEEALKTMPGGEGRVCVDDIYYLFMRQRHILADHPGLTFQQMYNELQWKKGRIKERAEEAREAFIKAGHKFLHQYREPKIERSHLITTLTGHSREVKTCMYSPDGARIVSGSEDGTLKIWDAKTGQEIATLSGHNTVITTCAYSPDGSRIVSGSEDKTLKIWDAKTGREIMALTGHSDDVTACAYSPDGSQIVSGSGDKTLKIWDAKTGQEITTFTRHNHLVNTCMYSPDGSRIVSGSWDNTLKIWDVKTGQEITTLSGHSEPVRTCAYSPDGLRIVSGCWDKTLKIWDATTGQEITTLTGHTDMVNSCAYSPDGTRIVTGSRDKSLKIWDAKTGQEIMTHFGHNNVVTACAYSPAGERIVAGSGDRTLKIWDVKTGREQAIFICDAYVMTNAIYRSGSKIGVGDYSGNLYFLKLEGFDLGPPLLTGVRLWHFNPGLSSGSWSPEITTVCPFCGIRFPLHATPKVQGFRGLLQLFQGRNTDRSILDTISALNRNSGIGPDDSPCLKLPDETWDEPKLLSECPNCGGKLKFNPFVVDNRGRWD